MIFTTYIHKIYLLFNTKNLYKLHKKIIYQSGSVFFQIISNILLLLLEPNNRFRFRFLFFNFGSVRFYIVKLSSNFTSLDFIFIFCSILNTITRKLRSDYVTNKISGK